MKILINGLTLDVHKGDSLKAGPFLIYHMREGILIVSYEWHEEDGWKVKQ